MLRYPLIRGLVEKKKNLAALRQNVKSCQQGHMRWLSAMTGFVFSDTGNFSSLMLLINAESHEGHMMDGED